MRFVTIIAALLAGSIAHAADKPCTPAQSSAAQKALDKVNSWDQLHKAWVDYGHCDANAVGEAYTDALLRLAIDWKNVPAFAGTVQKDAKYKEFIFAHLQSPAAKDDLPSLYSRAKKDCPSGLDAFCAEIADVTKPAPK